MIQFIRHRVNRAADLEQVLPEYGVEIDLRADSATHDGILLAHDPWTAGELLEDWLKAFARRGIRGPLALNTKEDGLEDRILGLLRHHGIDNFFFLDSAFPTLVRRCLLNHESHFAIRVSKYESVQALGAFEGKASWVWLDCFQAEPLPLEVIRQAKRHFKTCLVSPELHAAPELIDRFRSLLPEVDAVCTKAPELWRSRES